MPGKESKSPAKAAAKGGAPAKVATKPIKKGKDSKGGKKGAAKKGAKGGKVVKKSKAGAKGRSGYKGNLKIQSQIKEVKVKTALRKKAKNMLQKNPNAKHSKAYRQIKKQSEQTKIHLNKPPTRAKAARARTEVITKGRGYKNGQAPRKTIRKTGLHSWREGFPLFVNRPKDMTIGGSVRPKTDLKRFVKWPKYIRVQRQKRILLQRLKVPPMVNQFRKPTRRNHALNLFRLLKNYKPEDSLSRKRRLLKLARAKATGGKVDQYKKPQSVITGVKHVTQLVFSKQAKLVLIAADVDPIEIVLWLPTLCRKMDVPYMIVKGKARMGTLVNMKTCTAIAVTGVKREHEKDLSNFITIARRKFNDNADVRKTWGGLKLGPKSRQRIAKQKRLLKTEVLIRRRADAEKKKARQGL